MSPKRRKKLIHQEHTEDISYAPPQKYVKNTTRRGIKKFCAEIIDITNIMDWESDNYDIVYN